MTQVSGSLEESVQKYGCLRPVYYWRGKAIDGRKQLAAARSTGRKVEIRIDFVSEEEARHYLFHAHPRRALALWPCTTAAEARKKFDASISRVAPFFQPERSRKYAPRRSTGKRTRSKAGGARSIHLYLSDALHNQLRDWSSQIGVSASEYLRGALLSSRPDDVRSRLVAAALAARREHL